jgi:hypothetical protein
MVSNVDLRSLRILLQVKASTVTTRLQISAFTAGFNPIETSRNDRDGGNKLHAPLVKLLFGFG